MNDVQGHILALYKVAKQICEKHNIPYYAIGGTAIGAVRHNGFIPWDDDLDIAIPIEHFWEFFNYAKEELPSYYSIKNGKTDKYYIYPFGKIVDERTTFIEEWEKPDSRLYKGIFMDVMPIAGIPSQVDEQKKFMETLMRNIQLNNWRRVPARCSDGKKERIFKSMVKVILSPFPNDYYFKKVFEMLESRPLSKSENTGYTWGLYGGKKIIFSSEWFTETVEVPFEDTIMRCPIGYDEMLSTQFGDYMKLPPEEKRISMHKPFIDVNKSYKEYIINGFRRN